MLNPKGGNGSGRFEIDTTDMGGWVRACPRRRDNLPPDLPVYLSHTIAEWFRIRPHLRLRFVVPITVEGNTAEMHAWYEVHVLPPSPVAPKPTGAGPS